MKSELKEFLKLEKKKIIVSLIIPYFFIWVPPLYIGVGIFLVQSILIYPFVCAIFGIIRSYRGKWKISSSKRKFKLILLGLIVFNPLNAIVFINLSLLFFTGAYHYPTIQSVEIVNISSGSPIAKTSLRAGLKIHTIETYNSKWIILDEYTMKEEVTNYQYFRINNTDDFFNSLNNALVGQRVTVIDVWGSTYGFKKTRNISNWGIEVKDIKFKRGLFA